jgi:hypothetical protein
MKADDSLALLLPRFNKYALDVAFYRAARAGYLPAVRMVSSRVVPFEASEQAHPLAAALEALHWDHKARDVVTWLRDHWYLPTRDEHAWVVEKARAL